MIDVQNLIAELELSWSDGFYPEPEMMAGATLWNLPSCRVIPAFEGCSKAGLLSISDVYDDGEWVGDSVAAHLPSSRGTVIAHGVLAPFHIKLFILGMDSAGEFNVDCEFVGRGSDSISDGHGTGFADHIEQWCKAVSSLADCAGAEYVTILDRHEIWRRR